MDLIPESHVVEALEGAFSDGVGWRWSDMWQARHPFSASSRPFVGASV